MAQINTTANIERTTPPFVAEPMHPNTMIIGGARVDAAAFPLDSEGRRYIAAGTLVGRTFAERDANVGFGPVAVDATSGAVTDDEVYLTAFDVNNADNLADVELLRHGTLIYEDRLPNFAGLSAGRLAFIRDAYEAIVSVDGA